MILDRLVPPLNTMECDTGQHAITVTQRAKEPEHNPDGPDNVGAIHLLTNTRRSPQLSGERGVSST